MFWEMVPDCKNGVCIMQEVKKVEKAKRPSKKVLIAQIEKMGVDKNITKSLARANIETIQWVKSLIG